MRWVEIVAVLALIEYLAMGFMTGQARTKYGIRAPATTGHPVFERYFRVHQNMLEQLIVFVPALLLFGMYVSQRASLVLGVLFVLARIAYAIGYVKDPEKRVYGAGVTGIINVILVIGSLFGLLRAA